MSKNCCAAARIISAQWQMNVKICEQNCGLTRYSVYSVAMSSHWSKLTRQVSEHCLFALPAAILDTCFRQEKQWKYLVRCHAEWVCLFRNSNLCSSGLSMHCTDTHTLINTWSHTHTDIHTPSLGSWVLWVSTLCVFSITRPLITLSSTADSSPSVASLTDMQPYYRWRKEWQD